MNPKATKANTQQQREADMSTGPAQPEANQPQQPAGEVAASGEPVPGRSVLEAMAAETGTPGVDTLAPETDAQKWARLYPDPVVEERHRVMAAGIVGGALGMVEGMVPIKYGPARKVAGVDALAPLCAKYEAELPELYHKYRLEITALMWAGSLTVATVVEVKRVNAQQSRIDQRAKELTESGQCATRADAVERAHRELADEGKNGAASAA